MSRLTHYVISILVFMILSNPVMGQPAFNPVFTADGDVQATGQIAADSFRSGGIFGGTTYSTSIGGLQGIGFADGSYQATAASPSNCTAITYLPYTISTSGVYCFTGNLATEAASGVAISVEADNVVIDLNGWTLICDCIGLPPLTTGIGGINISNVTIRNGTIKKFHKAIHIQGGSNSNVMVENIRASNGYSTAVWIEGGSYHIVRGNQLMNNRETAIRLVGEGVFCIDNEIQHVDVSYWSSGETLGISLTDAPHSVVQGNRISTLGDCAPNCTGTYGVKLSSSPFTVIEGNHITNPIWQTQLGPMGCDTAINVQTSEGVLAIGNRMIGCVTGIFLSHSSSKYRDNLTANTINPYIGGYDSGNNY